MDRCPSTRIWTERLTWVRLDGIMLIRWLVYSVFFFLKKKHYIFKNKIFLRIKNIVWKKKTLFFKHYWCSYLVWGIRKTWGVSGRITINQTSGSHSLEKKETVTWCTSLKSYYSNKPKLTHRALQTSQWKAFFHISNSFTNYLPKIEIFLNK